MLPCSPTCPRSRSSSWSHDQERNPPFGTNLTFPLDRYTQMHQTSGTTGPPLRVLDTAEDWSWWRERFAHTLSVAGVGPGDKRRARLLVRPAHPVLGRQGGARGGRRDGRRARRNGLQPAPADDRGARRDGDLVHADLRAAAARGGRRAAARVRARLGRAGPLHGRAGRLAAGRAGAHRGGLRRALLRPRRTHRGRARSATPARRATGCTWTRASSSARSSTTSCGPTPPERARRAADHPAAAHRLPGAALPDRRRGGQHRRALPGRPRPTAGCPAGSSGAPTTWS